MIATRTLLAAAPAVFVVALVACGGRGRVAATPPSAKLVKSCEAFCDKRKECSAPADAAQCATRCSTGESVRVIDAFRPEASEKIWACITPKACEDLGPTAKRCFHEVATKLPASPKVRSLCAKLEDAFASCGAPWATPCVEDLSLFADEDLDGFTECIDRSCKSGVACFRSTEHELLTKAR
jgi:hypothetical protein